MGVVAMTAQQKASFDHDINGDRKVSLMQLAAKMIQSSCSEKPIARWSFKHLQLSQSQDSCGWWKGCLC